MYTKIISQQPLAVVTLDEAKRQLNIIDDDDDDTHIQLLIDVASDLAEGYTNRMLSKGVVTLVVTGKLKFYLPFGEATEAETAIVATVAVDQVPTEITFDFDEVSQILTIDDNQITESDKVTITYHAGYDKAPNSAKMGVLMLVDSLFENRGDSVVGATVTDIPLGSKTILNRIKLEKI